MVRILEVYIDGGCLRNGKPDAKVYISLKVYTGGYLTHHIQKKEIPTLTTNNQAEWWAFIELLSWLLGETFTGIVMVHTDSQLLYSQYTGKFKIQNPTLQGLSRHVKDLVLILNKNKVRIQMYLVPRERIVKQLGH